MNCAHTETPDVLLMDIEDAVRLLEDAGLAFSIVETKAPRKPPEEAQDGRRRVIRLRADGAADRLELTVCRYD
jgi:citrate lyase beta subunit